MVEQSVPGACRRSDGYARWAPMYPPRPHNPLMEAEAKVVGSLFRAGRASSCARRRHRHWTKPGNADGSPAQSAIAGSIFLRRCCPMAAACFHLRAATRMRLPFRIASFDLVSLVIDVWRLPRPDPWISRSGRVLIRGGHLIYSDFHPEWSSAGWRRTFIGEDGLLISCRASRITIEAARRAAEHVRRAGARRFASRE